MISSWMCAVRAKMNGQKANSTPATMAAARLPAR